MIKDDKSKIETFSKISLRMTKHAGTQRYDKALEALRKCPKNIKKPCQINKYSHHAPRFYLFCTVDILHFLHPIQLPRRLRQFQSHQGFCRMLMRGHQGVATNMPWHHGRGVGIAPRAALQQGTEGIFIGIEPQLG